MLKPLRYFFFRVYSWKRPYETESLALFTALAATSAAVYLHLLALAIIAVRAMELGPGLTHDRNTSRMLGITVGLLIMAVFYRAWITSNKYITFADEFRDESTLQRQRRTILVITYAAVTFIVPFVLMIALRD